MSVSIYAGEEDIINVSNSNFFAIMAEVGVTMDYCGSIPAGPAVADLREKVIDAIVRLGIAMPDDQIDYLRHRLAIILGGLTLAVRQNLPISWS